MGVPSCVRAPRKVKSRLRVHISCDGMFVQLARQLRSTSTTGMNEQSSRSHAILQMTLRNPRGKLHGQMSFIDLAGSEKVTLDTNTNTNSITFSTCLTAVLGSCVPFILSESKFDDEIGFFECRDQTRQKTRRKRAWRVR